MLRKVKYLISLVSSQLICSLIAINAVNEISPILMYMYMVLPIVATITACILYKQRYFYLVLAGAYIVFISCFVIFWFNTGITAYISIDSYSITAIVYLVLTIIFTSTFPNIEPNAFYGIRTAITQDYPEVWEKAHKGTSVIISWTIIPQFLLIFYLSGWFKFAMCNVLIITPLIIGAFFAEIIGYPIVKAKKERDKKDLQDQIKREQGYR